MVVLLLLPLLVVVVVVLFCCVPLPLPRCFSLLLSPADSSPPRSDQIEDALGQHSIKRLGTPRDIAEAVAFLADDKSSGFITGQEIVVSRRILAELLSLFCVFRSSQREP